MSSFHGKGRGHSENEGSDFVYGRWPVREALESGAVIKVFIAQGVKGEPVDQIVELARQKKVPFHWIERVKLERMVTGNHQGVVAQVTPFRFSEFDVLLKQALAAQVRGPSLLFLDGITDPQNLGSILRSAVFFGVPGVVIPKWRAASVTESVVRASAGAARHMSVAQVSNLAQSLEHAKEQGFWILGADMGGDDVKKMDPPRPFVLVLGSEGEGLHQLIQKKCDVVARIVKQHPGPGVDSLNVGAACAVLLHALG